MKVLHVTKTSEASFWAVRQASYLASHGVKVHAILPSEDGAAVSAWRDARVTLHFLDCRLPVRMPAVIWQRAAKVRDIVDSIQPDLIHTHHVTTTLMMRLALGEMHPVPRVFQVPGPLHLEHWHTRNFEMALAGPRDFWIASSRFIMDLYEKTGIAPERLFLSYYTTDTSLFSTTRTGYLRRKLCIPESALVVGNINLIYPPKKYLGQMVGLKCHEDVIEAIRWVQQRRSGVWGVLAGGTFGGSQSYEKKLNALAAEKGGGRILMPGKLTPQEVAQSWPDFDCAVHVPLSENCGGVVEPLLSGVPTIAGHIGGLPEVVQPGITGIIVPVRDPERLAEAVLHVLDHQVECRFMARQGRKLAAAMFDPERCNQEVLSIYRHLLLSEPRPKNFDSEQFLGQPPLPAISAPAAFSAAAGKL
jgi:glycosyltransferase involved in cell wall biosynthesis